MFQTRQAGKGMVALALALLMMAFSSFQPRASAATVQAQASTHRVIYYYQTLTDLTPVIQNLNPATGKPYPTHINLGAFHLGPQSDGTLMHLNDYPPDNPIFAKPWQQLKQLQGMGVKLHMLLGGAACCSFQSLFSDWNRLYPVLKQTLQQYHFDGIDLDIEESVALTDVQRLIDQLSADFGSSFAITLAPVASDLTGGGGLSGFDYKDLYNSPQGARIAWFNTQFYSGFGSLSSTSDYDRAVRNGFPADKIVAGMLSNPANGGGYVNINTAASTVKQLARKYSNFGGVFAWEYFNSLPGGTAHPEQWSILMTQSMNS